MLALPDPGWPAPAQGKGRVEEQAAERSIFKFLVGALLQLLS